MSCEPATLERLEPRLLLSGSGLADVLAAVATDVAQDVTAGFSWSGYGADPSGGGAGVMTANLTYRFEGRPLVAAGEGGSTVTLDGEECWVLTGEPLVPVRTSRILLPQGSELVSVRITLGTGLVIAAGVDLLAAPQPVPLTEGYEAAAPPIAAETVRESFPSNGAVQFANEFLCGYSLGVLEVFPVRYEAGSGTLTYYSEIGVTVTTGPIGDPEAAGLRDSAADAARVLDLVGNDSAIHDYDVPLFEAATGGGTMSLPTAGQYEYVVITSQALEGAFQALVDHKIARGLSAMLVTTEYIYDHYTSSFAGEDDAAGRIREFITDAYANWNTRWVLLGGDTDQVAHRMVQVSANGYTKTFASDMYFACLDGPYNNDGDLHWADTNDGAGGGDVDRAPEVFVGRAAVSTFAEAENFVAKTVLYETSPPPNPTTDVWIGQKLSSDPLTWGATSLDEIITMTIPDGFDNITLYERDGTVSHSAVVGALNDSPNIANHLGHSSYTGSATLSRSDVDGLTNASPYFLYSQGCLAGQFEQNDAIAEHHVKAAHAAWAVIMNTHYGWYSSGIFPGGSHYWNLEFWDAVFQEEIVRVGEAHFDSKMDRYSAFGTGRWVFFSSTLFGDPETRFYAPLDGGRSIVAHRPSGELPAGQSQITLEFSEPMDLAGFSIADDVVSFTGPGGADLRDQISGFAWLDSFTLAIDFQSQSSDGGYELVLGPHIPDAGGEAMDQDNDGSSGETSDDRYVAAFTLESSPGVVEVVRNDGVGPPSTLTSLAFTFSEDVSSSIDVGDLALFNDTAGAAVDMSQAAVSYDSGTNAARWDLTGLWLDAGYYTATLSAGGITDVAGNWLDGDGDGAGGDDYSLSVLVALGGDADLDGDVDLDDLTVVGTYYGIETGATWDTGDFDGDGGVDLDDLTLMATNYDRDVRPLGASGEEALPTSGAPAVGASVWPVKAQHSLLNGRAATSDGAVSLEIDEVLSQGITPGRRSSGSEAKASGAALSALFPRPAFSKAEQEGPPLEDIMVDVLDLAAVDAEL